MVDDRILLRWIEVHRLEHQTVEIGDAVARLYRDRLGGFQPAASSLEMSAFSSVDSSLPSLSRSTVTGGVSGLE